VSDRELMRQRLVMIPLTRRVAIDHAVDRPLMARLVALCAGLILCALASARTEGATAHSPCPRPSDQYGPRYETMRGAFRSRGVSQGGGKFVIIMPRDGAAPVSVNVTDKVFEISGSLVIGTRITLVGYVRESLSGAQPPYGCIEFPH
jgi:hypothetical protein